MNEWMSVCYRFRCRTPKTKRKNRNNMAKYINRRTTNYDNCNYLLRIDCGQLFRRCTIVIVVFMCVEPADVCMYFYFSFWFFFSLQFKLSLTECNQALWLTSQQRKKVHTFQIPKQQKQTRPHQYCYSMKIVIVAWRVLLKKNSKMAVFVSSFSINHKVSGIYWKDLFGASYCNSKLVAVVFFLHTLGLKIIYCIQFAWRILT